MENKIQQNNNDRLQKDMIGKSFLDGKERLDVIEMVDDQFLVRRTKDHPFLQGKKAVKDEKWNVEDFNKAVDNGTLTNIPVYAYATTQKAYEINEVNLRNKGLVSMQRNDNGLTLTFDHPVTRTEMGLSNLTPIQEPTVSKQQTAQTNNQDSTQQATVKPSQNDSNAQGQAPQAPSAQATADMTSAGNKIGDGSSPKQTNNQSQKTNVPDLKPDDSKNEISPLLKQFYDLKAKHPDALLLFRCGDFYETYQQDAKKASQILGITLTRSHNRKEPDGKPIEMAGFPYHALDAYLPKLIRAGNRVAICDQLVDPKLTKTLRQKTNQTDVPSVAVPQQQNEQNARQQQTNQPEQQTQAGLHTHADVTQHPNQPADQKTSVPPVAVAQQQNGQTPQQGTATPAQNQAQKPSDKQSLVNEIYKNIGKNKGVAFTSEPPLMVKTSRGIEFEANRVIREDTGNLRVYGIDAQEKERSVPIEKVNNNTLSLILKQISSNESIILNSQANTIAQNQKEVEQHRTNTPTLSDNHESMIKKIKEIIGEGRGVGVSPKMPILARSTAGDEFPVDMIIKDRQGDIRLVGRDFLGIDRSVTLQKAGERTLEEILKHLYSSNLINVKRPGQDGQHSSNKPKTVDKANQATDLQMALVNRMEELGMDRFKFDPIKVHIDDPTHNIDKNVDVIKIIADIKDPIRSITLVDKDFNSYGLEWATPNDMLKIMQKVTSLFNKTYGKQNNEQNNQDQSQSANVSQTNNSRQNRKLLEAEKVHATAKNDFPNDLVFVRLRDPESKKLMFQTFGNDTQQLQKISPSVSIENIEIKKKQHPVVTLQQENLAAVRADLMTQNVIPVIINAKGAKVENDHFLAFSNEERQNFINQQQTAQTTNTRANQTPADTPSADNKIGDGSSPSQTNTQGQKTNIPDLKTNDSTLSPDNLYQYMVKRNSHYPGVFDIRLYVNGEKAGAHRMSEQDRDLWREQKVKIEDLMVKYFGKELGISQFPNMSFFKGDNDSQQVTATQQNSQQPEASPEKVKNYDARVKYHQEVSQKENKNNDALVLLKMQTKDGNTFFQTYNKDADIAADILNRKTITIGENKYVSLTEKDVNKLTEQIGNKVFVADYDPHTSLGQTQKPGKMTKTDLPEIKPNTKVEYVISPVMNTNKETGQQERVPGVYALAITAEGKSLGRKTLTKEERDLLDRKPSEITNVINNKFAKELQGTTLSFKQVHRPAVSDEQWNNRDMGGGLTLDYSRVTNNSSENRYEMTAKINGVTLGPKPMYKQEVNDFFDKARPLTEIVAKVFRDELKSMGQNTTTQQASVPKVSGSQAMEIWHKAHEDGNTAKVAFIQREGRYGVFYQTFGEDAKNMSKVTNRSLKVTDTDTKKNVIYASIPEDQIQTTFKQLRARGFQPFAINTKGEPVSIVPEQKVSNPKSIALEDGRRVDDISLRNTGGKWIMTASIDGKPMPQREISMEDAKTFKQGQQTMSDILTKYFKYDIAQQQDSTKKGMGR